MNIKLLSLTLLAGFFILGCQATPKLPVPKDNPLVPAVLDKPDAYLNRAVTWGGVILSSQAKKDGTEIILLAKRLERSTRPVENDVALGRFIARIKGFVDPAVLAKDRELSVNGVITGKETRKVGEFDYLYPVVSVNSYHLWPVRIRYHDDYYWDPWYGPWYYPYPYYYPYRSRIMIEAY